MQGNTQHQSEKPIPIRVVNDKQDDYACPTALSAYKILSDLSLEYKHTTANNQVSITHRALAKCIDRSPEKSICALNCLERMGYIKIISLENVEKNCLTNKIELLYPSQSLKKTA